MYQKYQKVPKYSKYTQMYPDVSKCLQMYHNLSKKKVRKTFSDLVKVIIMVLYYGYMQYRFSIESKVKRNTIVL